jgi:hypothetical protein
MIEMSIRKMEIRKKKEQETSKAGIPFIKLDSHVSCIKQQNCAQHHLHPMSNRGFAT